MKFEKALKAIKSASLHVCSVNLISRNITLHIDHFSFFSLAHMLEKHKHCREDIKALEVSIQLCW